jgi:hypothetical protein
MKRAVALALAGAMMAACGGGGDERRVEEQAAQEQEAAAAEAAKGLEEMARGLEALAGGGDGSAKAVDPVSFRDLITLLPELDGWERSKPTGERMTSPVSFAQAEADYRKGDASIEVKIIDSGFHQLLLTPYSMFLASGYERETSEGHEKSVSVNGQPGWEKWDIENRSGEVNALVGKRFLVTISGYQLDDLQQLHTVASRIDMNRLASLQ